MKYVILKDSCFTMIKTTTSSVVLLLPHLAVTIVSHSFLMALCDVNLRFGISKNWGQLSHYVRKHRFCAPRKGNASFLNEFDFYTSIYGTLTWKYIIAIVVNHCVVVCDGGLLNCQRECFWPC